MNYVNYFPEETVKSSNSPNDDRNATKVKFSNYQIEIWIIEITIAVTNPVEYVFSQRFYERSKSPWLNLGNSKDSTSSIFLMVTLLKVQLVQLVEFIAV